MQLGLAPHAPYSVAPALFAAARRRGLPLSIHVAETEDERRFLDDGRGPFRELLEELGRFDPHFEPPRCSPVAYLERLGLLGPRCLAVHLLHLEPEDPLRLARSGAKAVLCPGAAAWFDRPAPPVRALLEAGVEIGLGTDSAAGNETLDLLHETAVLSAQAPWLGPERILSLATAGGAAVLGRPAEGCIQTGRPLRGVVLEGAPGLADVPEWVVAGRPAARRLLDAGAWDRRRGVL